VTDSLSFKVEDVLRGCIGDLVERLSGTSLHPAVIRRIAVAHSDDLGAEDAAKLGTHMSDWIGDAAFLFALHLFPDRFSDAEIRDGIDKFLCHAPNHIRAACGITGSYVWETFPDEDEAL